MAKKTINELFDEFEAFIEDCKVQTFSSNRLVVPRDELFNRIREIRMKLPSEVEKSTQLMGRRDQILKDAHDRAEQIKIVAQEEAQRRIGETEVMKQAMEQAKTLINQANLKAQEIINDAVEESNTIRVGALNYTNNVMIDLSDFTAAILKEEGERFQQLVDTMKEQYDVIETNRRQITSQLQSGVVPQDDAEQTAVTRSPAPQVSQTVSRPAAPRVAEQERVAASRVTAAPQSTVNPAQQTSVRTAQAAPAQPVASVRTAQAAPSQPASVRAAQVASTQPVASVRTAQAAPSQPASVRTAQAVPAQPAASVRTASGVSAQPMNPPKKPMTSEDMPVEDELDELDELYLDQY